MLTKCCFSMSSFVQWVEQIASKRGHSEVLNIVYKRLQCLGLFSATFLKREFLRQWTYHEHRPGSCITEHKQPHSLIQTFKAWDISYPNGDHPHAPWVTLCLLWTSSTNEHSAHQLGAAGTGEGSAQRNFEVTAQPRTPSSGRMDFCLKKAVTPES